MIEIKNKLSGEYRVNVVRSDGSVEDTGWMKNLVLDAGLDYIGTGSSWLAYCKVGTGSTTPAVGQTSLAVFLASNSSSSTNVYNIGASTYAGRYDVTYTFNLGAVVGNITELGAGWNSASSGGLFSRALIVDGAGVPTSLSVTSADQLIVFYRLTCTPELTDATYNVTISGVVYSVTARASGVGGFLNHVSDWVSAFWGTISGDVSSFATQTLGAVTSVPAGTNYSGTASVSYASYTNGNFYRDATITLAPAICNPPGGIGSLVISWGSYNYNEYQYSFTPVIPKDNTKQLVLTVRYIWGR